MPTLTKQIYAEGLKLLTQAFPSYKLTDHGTHLLYTFVQDIPDEVYAKAVTYLIAQRVELYPGNNMAALIRQAAGQFVHDRSESALEALHRAISHYGDGRSLQFGDPLIHAVVAEMGGLSKAIVPLKSAEEWDRDFLRRYQARRLKGTTRIPPYLIGSNEINNRQKGYPIDPPIKLDEEGHSLPGQRLAIASPQVPQLLHPQTKGCLAGPLNQVMLATSHTTNPSQES